MTRQVKTLLVVVVVLACLAGSAYAASYAVNGIRVTGASSPPPQRPAISIHVVPTRICNYRHPASATVTGAIRPTPRHTVIVKLWKRRGPDGNWRQSLKMRTNASGHYAFYDVAKRKFVNQYLRLRVVSRLPGGLKIKSAIVLLKIKSCGASDDRP